MTVRRDGVSTAFEMMLEEIEAVEAQLRHEGASAFQESRYSDADRLSTTGIQLGAFRQKLESLRNEWSSGIDVNTRQRVKVQPGYTIQPHKKGPRTNLRITLSTGRVIQRPTAAQAMADTIEELGIEKVKNLGLKVSNIPLVGTEPHPKYSQTPLGRYFICTHSNTKDKKTMLEDIASKLNQRIRVEVISSAT